MSDFIRQYVRNITDKISDESIEKYAAIYEEKKYFKGDILLSYGKVNTKCFLVVSGLIASFTHNEDGSNFIRTIFNQGLGIASLASVTNNETSTADYTCLTDYVVLECYWSDFVALTEQHTDFLYLYINILEKTYMYSEKRIHELSSFDATQRYMELKKDIPNIDNILPQYQIANYLNVTPVQLSRIRKKIFSK